MAVKTDTLLMLGGLAVLGAGMFYFMNKQSQAAPPSDAAALTDSVASGLNVRSDAQYSEMLGMMQSMLSQVNTGGKSKAQAQQELISGYVSLGVGSATQIASAIASIVGAL